MLSHAIPPAPICEFCLRRALILCAMSFQMQRALADITSRWSCNGYRPEGKESSNLPSLRFAECPLALALEAISQGQSMRTIPSLLASAFVSTRGGLEGPHRTRLGWLGLEGESRASTSVSRSFLPYFFRCI